MLYTCNLTWGTASQKSCCGSYLDEISERLSSDGIPHVPVMGSLDDPGAILEAARSHGLEGFEGHLWVGSLLESFYLMRHRRGDLFLPTGAALCEVCLGDVMLQGSNGCLILTLQWFWGRGCSWVQAMLRVCVCGM
jgi:hypothetical protein